MSNIVERLRADAVSHREVAGDCDCRPEDTVNWQHALNADEAADEIERLRAALTEIAAVQNAYRLIRLLADELADEITARYEGTRAYPTMRRRYERNMSIVVEARQFLHDHPPPQEPQP